MAVTNFLDLDAMPNQSQPKPVFDRNMGNFYRRLPAYTAELNALLGQVAALNAGGAFALPYVIDSSTVNGAPASGRLRFSNASQSASTVLRLSTTAGAQDVTNIIDSFDAATSGVKGSIRLVSVDDPTKWIIFDITAKAILTGYRNVSINRVASSAASPFSNGEAVLLFFQRNGDLATVLPNGQIVIASYVIATQTASISFANAFSQYPECSKFSLEFEGVKGTGATNLTLAVGGVLQGGGYYTPASHGGTFTADSKIQLYASTAASFGFTGTIEIRNARGANSATGVGIRGHGGVSGVTGAGVQLAEALYTGASAVSGLGLSNSSFTEGTIHLIGHRTKL